MSDLVERVARALCAVARFDSRHWEDFIPEARAAIRVVLDEAANAASRQTTVWVNGLAITSYGSCYQKGCEDTADRIRALIPKDGE
jgi:hypothetical protein